MAKQVYYEDVIAGSEIPPLVKQPTTHQLVMWAGAAGDYYAKQRVGVISSLRELTLEYHSSSPHPAVRPLVVLADQ